MKRKMVSFILCIAMCMALAIPAFAVELSPYATDEVGNFSQMIEFAFSDNVEGRFRYSYNDAAGNVVDGIVIKEISTDGTTKDLQYWWDGAPRRYPRYFCKSPFVSAPQRSGGYRVRDGNKVVHKMVCKRQSAELY